MSGAIGARPQPNYAHAATPAVWKTRDLMLPVNLYRSPQEPCARRIGALRKKTGLGISLVPSFASGMEYERQDRQSGTAPMEAAAALVALPIIAGGHETAGLS